MSLLMHRFHHQLVFVFTLLTALCALVLVSHAQAETRPTQPEPAPLALTAPFRFFPETGHNVGAPFLHFFDAHGGIDLLGLPITEVITDTTLNVPVQYFERARLELHTDRPPDEAIVLSHIGHDLTTDRQETDAAFQAQVRARVMPGTSFLPGKAPHFFSETGHTVRGPFATFWHKQGGVERWGYPISQPLLEDIDGTLRLVQYFERARLEYIPAQGDEPSRIEPGLLGQAYAELHEVPKELLAPAPEIVSLGTATTPYYNAASPEGKNIILAAQHINETVIEPGASMSFLDAVGPITAQAGYGAGAGIVGNEIQPMIGGGICQTSSALYVAALYAGVDILERHNHSYVLGFFQDTPGMEAAVYEGWGRQDLRWRNDTPHPIYVEATVDYHAQVVRVTLWGISDERQVVVGAPAILQTHEYEEEWIFDEEMEDGESEETRRGIVGLDVAIWRQVLDADGAVLHDDYIVTHYKPLDAVFHHGPGGNPNETPTPTDTPETAPTEPALTDTASPAEPTATPTAPSTDIHGAPKDTPTPPTTPTGQPADEPPPSAAPAPTEAAATTGPAEAAEDDAQVVVPAVPSDTLPSVDLPVQLPDE